MLVRLIGRLPTPLRAAAKKSVYLILYRILGYRRKIVEGNLSQALPELSKQARDDIAKAYYAHLARLVLEVARTAHMQRSDFSDHISLVNPELVESATKNFTRSTLFVGIHQGNWEWMLHAISQRFNISIDPIYKPLHNASADAFMLSVRSQFGGRPIAASDTGAYVLKNRGKPSTTAVLSDQAPVASDKTIETVFLGRETRFNSGFAQLARMTKATVIFVQCHAVDSEHYAITFYAINDTSSVQTMTQRYVELAEQSIRSQPYTWLWSHNRWKRSAGDL